MNEKVSKFFKTNWRVLLGILSLALSVVVGCTLCTPRFDVLVKNVKVVQRPYVTEPSVKP